MRALPPGTRESKWGGRGVRMSPFKQGSWRNLRSATVHRLSGKQRRRSWGRWKGGEQLQLWEQPEEQWWLVLCEVFSLQPSVSGKAIFLREQNLVILSGSFMPYENSVKSYLLLFYPLWISWMLPKATDSSGLFFECFLCLLFCDLCWGKEHLIMEYFKS